MIYAVVRINQLDRDRLRTAQDQLREFGQTHSAQPGYRGTFNIDLGSDRHLIVNLWDSEQHAAAGRAALSAGVAQLLEPGAGPALTAARRRPGPRARPAAQTSRRPPKHTLRSASA